MNNQTEVIAIKKINITILLAIAFVYNCDSTKNLGNTEGFAEFHRTIDDQGNLKNVLTIDNTPVWYYEKKNKKGNLLLLTKAKGADETPVFRFHDNGKLRSVEFWENQVVTGKVLKYYADGALHRYIIYKSDKPLFQVNYDSSGYFQEQFGNPILKITPRPNKLRIGDSISFEISVAIPPGSFRQIRFEVCDSQNNVLSDKKYWVKEKAEIQHNQIFNDNRASKYRIRYLLGRFSDEGTHDVTSHEEISNIYWVDATKDPK